MDGFLPQLRFSRKHTEFVVRLERRERTVYLRHGKRYLKRNEYVVYETFNGQSADVRGCKNVLVGRSGEARNGLRNRRQGERSGRLYSPYQFGRVLCRRVRRSQG